MKKNTPNDSFRRSVRRAYKATDLYVLNSLFSEQSRWQRKQTIAANKLASVRRRIDALALDMAQPPAEERKEP